MATVLILTENLLRRRTYEFQLSFRNIFYNSALKGGEYEMKHKKIMIMALTAVVVAGVVMAPSHAYAEEANTQHINFFQGLVESIAQKFGLDKNKVQTAVTDYQNQHKQTRQENMKKRQEDRLSEIVSQGKITDAQKQAILKEWESLRTKYNPDTMKNLTPEQRKDQMIAMQDELDSWAKSQGIDPAYVRPGFGMGPRGMRGGFMKRTGNWNKTTSPSPSP